MPPAVSAGSLLPAELLELICKLLDFRELVNFARSGTFRWQSVDYLLKTRLRHVLLPFIPADKFDAFMAMLNDSEGAIVGLAALELILYRQTRHAALNYPCLEIHLPSNSRAMSIAIQFFRSIGYTGFDVNNVHSVNDQGEPSNMSAGGSWDAGVNPVRFVRLVACRGGPFAVLVEGSSTHLMNAVSPDGIYCLYADLTLSGLSLAPSNSSPVTCLATTTGNSHWGRLCMTACPRLCRKTLDDEGSVIHRWRVPVGSAYLESNEVPVFIAMLSLFRASSDILLASFTDVGMKEISDKVVEGAEAKAIDGTPPILRYAMLFGAGCSVPLRVAVEVHSGFETKCRPFDLHVEAYLDRIDFQQQRVA
ncbi:hypothetical protein BKA70DRAFT_1433965 [Coprinopsis sp. MPI-PUGE-AT-0042]|nr:hypothetical protein BKA70DRAFT_1433965 [Coprinopsis sp. MPI-PUGE-AT-0042]